MRINVKISSWQDSWHPYFPTIDLDACYPKDEHGEDVFDEENFRMQVRDQPCIQIGSKDRPVAMAFAAILIASVNDWLNANDSDDSGSKARRVDAQIKKRIERGAFSCCRIDITDTLVELNGHTYRTAKVNITTNDNDAMQRNPFERDFAMIVADFCRCYSNKYVARGEPALVFTESTQKVLDELHKLTQEHDHKEAVRKANEERLICDNYIRGFCSPCKFNCPHYKCGKCVEIK